MSARHIIKNQKGFTLIELLVVIGILAVLLAITLIAINPARQFQQANDTKRSSDVNAILNAVNQYMADNKGALPAGVGVCTGSGGCAIKGGTNSNTQVDLCTILVTKYLAALPVDPTAGTDGSTVGSPVADCANHTSYDTGYSIVVSSTDNRITVSAVGQITNPITVTR